MALKHNFKYLFFVFSLVFISSCNNEPDSPLELLDVQLVTENGITYKGGEFFLNITTNNTWRIAKNDQSDWYSFSATTGQGNKTVVLTVALNSGVKRSSSFDVIAGTKVKTIQFAQSEFKEDATLFPTKEAYRIEVPRLSNNVTEGGAAYIAHYAKDIGGNNTLNFSFEYNFSKHHTRWVAFTFDSKTIQSNTSRSDAWAPDPLLLQYTNNDTDYRGSGYTRGHLVASADRLFSKQANEQTFYFSNISPQGYSFNTGIWADLESKVRGWGGLSEVRDTLYVTKGGTIEDNQILGSIGENKIAIPKYFFMAILAKKGATYKSIAFYIEHKQYTAPYNVQNYTLSVDDLETKTGIDFFHNLPDEIEKMVETQKNPVDWPGL